MNMEQLAELCHESLQMYRIFNDLPKQESWLLLPEYEKDTMREMTKMSLSGALPSRLHSYYCFRTCSRNIDFQYLDLVVQYQYCLLADIVKSLNLVIS